MKQPLQAANNRCHVFVGNMSAQITESELKALVESFGAVKNFSLVKAHAMGDSCGFAFVEMSDEGAVTRAIAELNGKSIAGRCLRVRHLHQKPRMYRTSGAGSSSDRCGWIVDEHP